MKSSEVPYDKFSSLADILINIASAHPDKMALRIKRDGEFKGFTYKELLDNASKLGKFLIESGLKEGERVALLGENCPEWGLIYFGITWAGGVILPIDPRESPERWAHILRHAETKFIFCSNRYKKDVEEIKERVESLQKIISFDDLPQIINQIEKGINAAPRKRTDLAVLLYTSGTEGVSKGVMLSHGNLISNVHQVTQVFADVCEEDRFFSVLPLHHVYEGTAGFLSPISLGAEITYARSLRSREMIEDLRDTRPTFFVVVPLLLEKMYQGIVRRVEELGAFKKIAFSFMKSLSAISGGKLGKSLFKTVREQLGLDKVKYIVCGGAPLPRWLSKELELMGFPIFQGYGLSEASPVVSVNPPAKPRNESVGKPLPGCEVRIDNPDDEGIGEICVRGPNVMMGYYKNEEETRKVLKDGWLYTGDMGKIDKDGYLYVTGRKKSVIITKGGKNIYPEELENLLTKSPFIEECVVTAKAHPRTGRIMLNAIIYPNYEFIDKYAKEHHIEIDTKTLENLLQKEIDEINKSLPDYKKISGFTIRDEEFPKTTTQKIKRYLFTE